MTKTSLWKPHLRDFVSSFSKNFYWTTPNFLNLSSIDNLLRFAKEKEKKGLFKPAAVGKGVEKKRASFIRSDLIFWMEEFSGKDEQIVFHIFDELKIIMRNEFYLPAKRFECHFAKYEPGSFYKLHEDRHQNMPGRLVTCVLYLTNCTGNFGNLILYDEELKPIKIKPASGRIVVFDSSLEHEVLATKSDRWSLTGWIRDDLHPGLRF